MKAAGRKMRLACAWMAAALLSTAAAARCPADGGPADGSPPAPPEPSWSSELTLTLSPALVYRTDAERLQRLQSAPPSLRAFYDYEALPAALELSWQTRLRGVSTMMSLPARRSFHAAGETDLGTNVPYNRLQDLDTTFPFRGWVAWEAPWAGVRLARDRLAIGQGYWSSMIANGQSPYFDYLQAYYDLGFFRLSEYLIRLNPSLISEAERNRQTTDAYNNLEDAAYTERAKSVVVHELRWRAGSWLEVGVGEAIIVGGRSLQLADFNPALVFHNFYGEDWGNLFAFLNVRVTPARGVSLYADVAVDDLTGSTETEASSAPPPAWGALAGLQVRGAPARGLELLWVAEAAYVLPTFGMRTKPLQAPYSRLMYIDNSVGGLRVWVDYPLGYYLGNDLIDARTRLEARAGWGGLFVDYHELYKGQERIGADPAEEGTGYHTGFLPRGVVERTRELSAGVSYKAGGLFEAGLEGTLRFTKNRDHREGNEATDVSVVLRLSREFRF